MKKFSTFKVFKAASADEQGAVALIAAAATLAAFGVCALAVDAGALYLQRRGEQGVVDLAAVAAAADLAHAEEAAKATLQANRISYKSLSVQLGNYAADRSVAVDKRFTPGSASANAVRLNLVTEGRIYFAKAFFARPVSITVASTAATAAEATFSVGSRLAAVNGGLVNGLLGALTGSTLSLSVMDYNALASADVKLLDFMNALATHFNIKTGTYQSVLKSKAAVGDVASVLAGIASHDGNTQAAAALSAFGAFGVGKNVPLDQVVALGSLGALQVGDPSADASASFSAMQMLSGVLMIANGNNQVSLDLGATVPGIASLKLTLAVGQPMQTSPWLRAGGAGGVVRTVQTRLWLVAQVGGTGLLAGTAVRLPLYVDMAYAQARLASVSCLGTSGSVEVAALPGIVDARIGEVTSGFTDFTSAPAIAKAKIVTAPLLSVTGSAAVSAQNTSETLLEFTQSDIANGTIQQADTTNIVDSIATSLLSSLSLTVSALGLTPPSPALVKNTVLTVLSPVATALDGVLADVFGALGVHLGQADVRVNGVRCRSGALAG